MEVVMPQNIDGKAISAQIKEELKEKVADLKISRGISICLAVIQVGSDPASSVYVGNKKKACAYIGIDSRSYELPEETTQKELLDLIGRLNADDAVHGILVQLPCRCRRRLMKMWSSGRSTPEKTWMVSIRRVWARSVSASRGLYPVHRPGSYSF